MKKHIIIAPEFAIDSSIIKSIREKITGICSSTKLQITLDEISHSEAENVIQYLNSIGKFKVILDEDYYSSEELLNFDYFYCSGQVKPNTTIDFVDFEIARNGNSSFDYSDYCEKCKQGMKQIAPFVVKGLTSKYESSKFLTPFWTYWIVSYEVREKIVSQNISGVEFLELYNRNGVASKTNYQMKPMKILEKTLSLEHVKKINNNCNCSNSKIGLKENSVKLYKESRGNLDDFNELYEHNISKLNGMYIMSKNLLRIFIDEKILPHKDITVYPVEFI